MPLQATKPNTLTINAQHVFFGLMVNSYIKPDGTLGQNGVITLQRAEKREDGTWITDPTQGSSQSIPINGSLSEALQEFPQEVQYAVYQAWQLIEQAVGQINVIKQLV